LRDTVAAVTSVPHADALVACRRAVELAPRDVGALTQLGVQLSRMGEIEEALTVLQRAIAIDADSPQVLLAVANALMSAGRPGNALALFDRLIALQPELPNAQAGRGLALAAAGADDAAIVALGRAVELDPRGAPPVLIHLGYQFLQMGRPDASHAAFCRLLAAQPGRLDATQGRIMALFGMSRFEEALPGLAALQAAMPGIDYLPGVCLHAQLQCCDWSDYQATAAAISEGVRRKERADTPHAFIVHSNSPAEQRLCAQNFVADRCTADSPPLARPPLQPHSKLRIAYLSSDLRDHAVGQLLAGVFEAHDRERFETFAFSCGPSDGTDLRRRLERAFDHFIDVISWSDRAIAARMVDLGIDVAIDLGGHSSGGRTRVLSFRPAPIQMSLLGYPGTLGTDYVDYLFADAIVIPAEQRQHYAEQLIYLPDSFLPTGGAPAMSAVPTREAAGLPADGIVYCCFNAPYKITPDVFDAWMRVLHAVPRSVLWLRESSGTVRRNLAAAAARRGIEPARLIFAARTAARAEHYARFSLADVFLDTSPYNAHTTAAEALGIAVPVVTLRGSTFAGRVAASLLAACGVGELAVDTMAEYEALAIELARDPQSLANLKERLRRARAEASLFDPVRYCRHLEAALAAAWVRHERGEPAATLTIEH
jgi:protein O-GlcNAc transferase